MLGRYPHCHGSPGRRDHDIVEAAMSELRLLGLGHRLMPSLSGGEAARVHLARVLAQIWEPTDEARYLLLDEPTASLDLAHQHRALRILRDFARHEQAGMCAIVHDLNLGAQYADRMVLLNGPPQQILSARAVADCFGVQVDVLHCPERAVPLVVARAALDS
jgi:iron complex transport system ATP-binding protein